MHCTHTHAHAHAHTHTHTHTHSHSHSHSHSHTHMHRFLHQQTADNVQYMSRLLNWGRKSLVLSLYCHSSPPFHRSVRKLCPLQSKDLCLMCPSVICELIVLYILFICSLVSFSHCWHSLLIKQWHHCHEDGQSLVHQQPPKTEQKICKSSVHRIQLSFSILWERISKICWAQ